VANQTEPEDYDPIFRQGVVIVGGQAVNLWGKTYARRGDPILEEFEPFVSKDADIFLSDRNAAARLAAEAGWQYRDSPYGPETPIVGFIELEQEDRTLRVDVLRSVKGLADSDLVVRDPLLFSTGIKYFVPAPDVILRAKLANLAGIFQDDRDDERQVRIMIRCCQHYLLDAAAAVKAERLSENEAFGRFAAVHSLITTRQAKRLDRKHGLALAEAIPTLESLVAVPKLCIRVRDLVSPSDPKPPVAGFEPTPG